ncbi:FtsQ-type POTRA domain-containing protein [Agromyces allii]|uniref:FtsQ-type POTRA domain-containing protein n=1 Tax=Agromyces allii TaxID=393607 RepID=UPI001FE378E8|nr:FtsQ-type POTRA domain-containing protein [Agromyces allii]
MKRPQGFDRPAQPRPAASGAQTRSASSPAAAPASAQASTPPARRGAGARGRADASRQSPAASETALTEPFEPLPADRASAEAPRASSGTVPGGASAEDVATRSTSDTDMAVDGASPPRSGWAARRALARATRDRRRYERAEVRRFTVRTRRRRLAWGIGLGVIGLLVAVVLIGAYSPVMALRVVRVEGASRVPAAEVESAFAPMLGTPLALIDRAGVQKAMSRFPLIETYQTEAVPPDTLVVRIVERTPVGVIETADGLALVDAAGVVMDRPEARPEGQPLITVDGGVASDGFRAVAGVVRSLPAEIRAQVTAASAETADDVTLQIGDAKVVWGSAEQSSLKADVLDDLMRAAPPGSVSLYDVSAPMSPVTM